MTRAPPSLPLHNDDGRRHHTHDFRCDDYGKHLI